MSLEDGIIQALRDFPGQFVCEPVRTSDSFRIRRRGPGLDFDKRDVVAVYNDSDWDDGKISPDSIRRDIRDWQRRVV